MVSKGAGEQGILCLRLKKEGEKRILLGLQN